MFIIKYILHYVSGHNGRQNSQNIYHEQLIIMSKLGEMKL